MTRRWLLALGPALAVLASPLRALAEACRPTPRQTMGPFYPAGGIAGAATDLTRTRPDGPRARGEVLYLSGRVVDRECRPVAGAEVEIWQADVRGRYNHPLEAPSRGPLDPNFRYWGEARSDAEGRYAFVTIVPAPYSGRTAHVHFRVRARGHADLVTQMYFEGQPLNARDMLLGQLSDEERARVVVPLVAAEDRERGAKRCEFEIGLA
jgi:protocatechuate 3,4-dioxygenase, beta subunit